MMALAWHQFRLERRMFWRNPTAAFFNFLLPLLLLRWLLRCRSQIVPSLLRLLP